MLAASYADELRGVGLRCGLDAVGVAAAEPFTAVRVELERRRREGLHAGMAFTYRQPARSTDPSATLEGAQALVVGARSYRRATAEAAVPPERPAGRVARYAWDDPYTPLRSGLRSMADWLVSDGWQARVVADENNLVDREAAHRAGIGWYGKNANILLPGRGSWFVLGSVVTDAPLLPAASPVADGCGSCTRCLEACPTGAIVAPGVVDARRCLAWLLQAPGDFPLEHRAALGDRIYGCDDCQEVCPPNHRAEREPPEHEPAASARPWLPLLDLLTVDDDGLLERCGRWYIPGRELRYVRRNALIALGNVGDPGDAEVWRVLRRYEADPDPILHDHASWAIERILMR